jgi:aminopeptidase N
MAFGAVTSDNIQIGSAGNVNKNAPYAALEMQLTLSLFFMFVSTAFVAGAVVRDDDTGFGPIIRTTRVRKVDYLFGRFLGAYAAIALAFLAVPLAIMVGSVMPWVDPEKLGPFRIGDYLYNYGLMALPALFIPAAAFFALATATRSLMATYIGMITALVLFIIATALGQKPEYMHTTALLDPFGLSGVDYITRYWTAAERNTHMVPITGVLLWNRLIWLGIAVVLLGLSYFLFSFEERAKRKRGAAEDTAAAPFSPATTRTEPQFGPGTALAQLWACTRLDMTQVFRSPGFFILLALGVVNAGAGLWFQDDAYGVSLYPVTQLCINSLIGAFSIIPVIVVIYYAGELVWRDTDRRIGDIIDATPVPDWAFVVPKILAMALVLAALLTGSILTAILVQLLKAYTHVEVWKYIAWYLVPLTISFTSFAVLALFVQAIVPQKFIGWGLMVVYIVASMVSVRLGYEHSLYRFGGGIAGPIVPLSDMNGLGEAGIGAWWIRFYWAFICLALAVFTHVLWRRGKQAALLGRLRHLPRRLAGPAGGVLAFSLLGALLSGGYIYLNTNIWNVYHTDRGDDRWAADMEKALLPFEKIPQPKITDIKLTVALYPKELRVVSDGIYTMQNKTDAPITDLHLRFGRWTDVLAVGLDGAHVKKTYDPFNYRIYALDKPMRPGETRILRFRTGQVQHGFSNKPNVTNVKVYDNGSFLDSFDIGPVIGMDRNDLLTDRAKRRQYGLPSELRLPKLEDDSARRFSQFIHDADWIHADITVSTDADQIPMAPGYKQSDVIADGRHTTRFVANLPILKFFSIQSARYAVQTDAYKGINLAVYYDPAHPANVARMLAALRLGLDYDQKNFSPFQFRQMRILEFPAYARFAQSFANTVPYSEGIGFVLDVRDPSNIDMVTYVTAHELGHQWWAHQAVGADMQGSTMLTESLAQYTAIMAMQQLYGRDQIRKFLKYELDNYLKSRGGEVMEELPLDRVENQPYIHYRKGSLVMYRLQDVLGEQAVDQALHDYLQTYAFKGPPYPKSTDLIALFRAQAGSDPVKQQLITDLFDKITVYDLHAVTASSHKRADGKYDVTVKISAKKNYADGTGKETEAPMNEPVDVGLFTHKPGTAGFTAQDVLALQRVQVHSGEQTYQFTTDRKPVVAGIDPYNTIINRNSDENLVDIDG